MAEFNARHGLEEVRKYWCWFLSLGIALVVLGVVAVGSAWIATLASVILFGWLVTISGVVEAAVSFRVRNWSGFLQHLLIGILTAILGLMILVHPVASAAGLTLVIAALFLIGGIFRLASAFALRYPRWIWTALDGTACIILGGMIFAEWPSSALWVIGTFLGISLIFRGWAWIMLSLGVRNLSETPKAA